MSSSTLASPCMSDRTILMSVEDLICHAMGPPEVNTVDFKMVQTILHILARQMRLLDQKVLLAREDLAAKGRRRKDDRDGRRTTSGSDLTQDRSRDGTGRGGKGGGRPSGWDGDDEDRGGRSRRYSDESNRIGRGTQYTDRGSSEDSDEGRGRASIDEIDRGGQDGKGDKVKRDGRDEAKHGGRGGKDRDGYDRGERGGYDEGQQGGRGKDGRSRDRKERGGLEEEDPRDADEREFGTQYEESEFGTQYEEARARNEKQGGGRDAKDHGGRDGEAGGARDEDQRGTRVEIDRSGRDAKEGGGRDEGERDRRGVRDVEDRGRRDGKERGGRDQGRRGGQDGKERDEGQRGERDGGKVGDFDGKDRGGRDEGKRGDYDGKEHGGRDVRERGRRDGGKVGGFGGKEPSGQNKEGERSSTQVREVHGPGKEKLLVVEKSSSTNTSVRGRDSIAVVTQSQFRMLERAVNELQKVAGPMAPLVMPENKQLRRDLAAGASLTDAMQAMQVTARMNAAEKAIGKLADLLTQLASSGDLPPAAANAALQIMKEKDKAIKPSAPSSAATTAVSKASMGKAARNITEPEMIKAFDELKDDVTREMNAQIAPAVTAAMLAKKHADSMNSKLEELMKMDTRIADMQSLVNDCADQLNGFDTGLSTQMQSFKEQMSTMRADLQAGMVQLDAANNNAETAAVMELNERYEALVRALEDTLLQHTALTNMQDKLLLELKALAESIEMLREQKADRRELIDGLRDKADIWRMKGLVKQEEFQKTRQDLEARIAACHEKFAQEDAVWREAIRDLTDVSDTKAMYVDLLKLRDEATGDMRKLDEKIRQLALILGEPKAAMLMRKLSRDAFCASCLAPALMELGQEPAPPLLPAARGPPLEPCVPEPRALPQPDLRTHKCHRWVGGSHTLLQRTRAHAAPLDLPDIVTEKYTGYGDDGKLYWLESQMVPCVECNQEEPTPPAAVGDGGAGDAENADTEGICTCD